MLKNPDPEDYNRIQRTPPPTLEIAMETSVQDPTPRTAIMNGTSPKIRQKRLGPLMTLPSPTNSSQNMLYS